MFSGPNGFIPGFRQSSNMFMPSSLPPIHFLSVSSSNLRALNSPLDKSANKRVNTNSFHLQKVAKKAQILQG